MKHKKLLVSITGRTKTEWQDKLAEINKHQLTEIALFMETFTPRARKDLLPALANSCVKKIPLVHIREDTTREEIRLLKNQFQTKYFTIHESHFPILEQWRGHYQSLYLELNTDDQIKKYVHVKKIGGFCIDLAHFKVEVAKQSEEYRYTVDKLADQVTVGCNHLSGYSANRNTDLHDPTSVSDFNYITTLPHAVFSRVVAFEVFKPIGFQLRAYPHVKHLLEHALGFTMH